MFDSLDFPMSLKVDDHRVKLLVSESFFEPFMGLEPTTCSLRMSCSTN